MTGQFAVVELDQELWEYHLESIEHQVKRQRLKKVKPPVAFEWQVDGIVYTVPPGKRVTIPLDIANAGVKNSKIFQRERDDHGNETKELDHDSTMIPMLDIVRVFSPSDPTMSEPVPEMQKPKCPFCKKEVDDMESHLGDGECSAVELTPRADAQLSGIQKKLDESMAKLVNA